MRFLIVGLGGIGQRHVRNLRALLGMEAEVLAWRTRGASFVLDDRLQVDADSGLEERYGVRAVPSLEDGLAEHPDAVFVCNPSSLHLEVARAAADAGCNLFIEKPLADTLSGVDELIAVAEGKGLVTLVGYQLRFHPLVRRVKQLLEESAVGSPLAARFEVGEYLPGWHPYEDYRRMYASRRELGGGVVLSQIHELDLVSWFFGMPRRLFALAGHWTGLEVDVEDVASTLLECRQDGRPLPVHVQQDFIQRPASRTAEIVGENGKIVLALHRSELRVLHAVGGEPETQCLDNFDRNELFLAELRHFLACLRGEESPLVPLRAGAESLRIALAARESASSGLAVTP